MKALVEYCQTLPAYHKSITHYQCSWPFTIAMSVCQVSTDSAMSDITCMSCDATGLTTVHTADWVARFHFEGVVCEWQQIRHHVTVLAADLSDDNLIHWWKICFNLKIIICVYIFCTVINIWQCIIIFIIYNYHIVPKLVCSIYINQYVVHISEQDDSPRFVDA